MHNEDIVLARELIEKSKIDTPYGKGLDLVHCLLQDALNELDSVRGEQNAYMTQHLIDGFEETAKMRASAIVDFLSSDFGQSGTDVQIEAIRCELISAFKAGIFAK